MSKIRKYLMIGGSLLVLSAGGAGVAVAQSGGGSDESAGNDNGDQTATGSGADQATAAALKATNGGHANAVERDSENGATWEVEVTKTDGNTVDVRLDQNDQVVVIESDSGN